MTSTPLVLVTGAAGAHGRTGAYLVRQLSAAGARVRALVRREDVRAEQLRAAGAETVVGDFLKLASLREAMAGVSSVYFCYPLADGLLQATTNVAVAARETGVRRVVNVSIMMVAPDHPSPVCRDHWLSEQILEWASIGAVHLRGGFFFENLVRFAAAGVAAEGKIYLPFGDGNAELAWVGGIDIARVAAAVLLESPDRAGRSIEVTGSEVLSIQDVAREFSSALGREIVYEALPLHAFLDRVQDTIGDNLQLRRHVSILSKAFSAGMVVGRISPSVAAITGHAPQTCAAFAGENAAYFSQTNA